MVLDSANLGFSGIGLSIFASVLQEIFYFKPQTIFVSLVFLTVIAYVLGDAMAFAIPRKGWLRYLNPHEFNQKEHAAITIMASAAAVSALATEALAAQALFYGGYIPVLELGSSLSSRLNYSVSEWPACCATFSSTQLRCCGQ